MSCNYLAHAQGDAINAILAAAGYNSPSEGVLVPHCRCALIQPTMRLKTQLFTVEDADEENIVAGKPVAAAIVMISWELKAQMPPSSDADTAPELVWSCFEHIRFHPDEEALAVDGYGDHAHKRGEAPLGIRAAAVIV